LVAYEEFGARSMIFWNGLWPFFFHNAQEAKAAQPRNNPGGNHESEATKVYSVLTFLRGTLDVEKLLCRACEASNRRSWSVTDAQERKNRFVIHYVPKRETEEHGRGNSSNGMAWYQQGFYRLLTHTPDQLGKAPLCQGSALGNLIFPQRIKDLIREI